MNTNTTPSGADARQARPPGIDALQCVIASLRDTAHFADEEGDLTNDLRALRDWAFARAAQAQEAAPRDGLHDCALGDSNYAAGMLLGWNLCTDGLDEDFRRIREDRLRAAASASKEAHEAAPAPLLAESSRIEP